MATATWNPGTVGSNLNTGQLDGLTSGSSSTFITYDNTSGNVLYGNIAISLASITSTTGANITLSRFSGQGATTTPDNTASLGGGERQNAPLTVGGSAKLTIFDVQLKPGKNYFSVTNGSGASFAASGNSFTVLPYGEQIT